MANKHGYTQHSSIMETSDWASTFSADSEHLKATVKTFGRGIGQWKSSSYEDFLNLQDIYFDGDEAVKI